MKAGWRLNVLLEAFRPLMVMVMAVLFIDGSIAVLVCQ
jgi:hypothetical protein